MMLQCEPLWCCLLARDVSDILPYPVAGLIEETSVHLSGSSALSLGVARLGSLLHPDEMAMLLDLATAGITSPLPALGRPYLVCIERPVGGLGLVASHVKIVLGVDLQKACRALPPLPGCSRVALAWLEVAGLVVPLLSAEALLWRHRARSEVQGLWPHSSTEV